MIKIRKGNDFTLSWSIVRDALAEDLQSAQNLALVLKPFNASEVNIDPKYYSIIGNNLTVDFTPDHCKCIGGYNLILTYEIADNTLKDGVRRCAVDIDLVEIVGKTAKADTVRNIAITSEVAIGFKGDKGDISVGFFDIEDGNLVAYDTSDNVPFSLTLEKDNLVLTI